jgi:hypothetical protein
MGQLPWETNQLPCLMPRACAWPRVQAGGAVASARGARVQAGEAAAVAHRGAPEADGGARAALHCRLFALLLRYKAITGAGFQAALPPAAFDVLHAQCAASRMPC